MLFLSHEMSYKPHPSAKADSSPDFLNKLSTLHDGGGFPGILELLKGT